VERKQLYFLTMYTFTFAKSFTTQEVLATTVILLTTGLFTAYWFIAQSASLKAWFYNQHPFDIASRKHIFFTKYMGFFLLGVIPVILLMSFFNVTLPNVGLTWYANTSWFTIGWTIVLSVLVIPLAYQSAKKPANLLNYPQIRAKNWTKKTFYVNLFGWAIYLFGYELLFRGVLLFLLVDAVGVPIAISINVMMYAISHIPKGLSETIGAIPLGLVLCVLSLLSGTIWIAFFVHIALSFTNSLTALAHHPEITYVNWKKKATNAHD